MLEAQQNEHQVLKIDIRGNITKFAMVIEMAGIFLLFQKVCHMKLLRY